MAMSDKQDDQPLAAGTIGLPETPYEIALDRGQVDAIVDRARGGDRVDLLQATLDAVDWQAFSRPDGRPLDPESLAQLRTYYEEKWCDIGPLFLAELLSTEFMTEQRARGDITFSERLLRLGREEPDLWLEIRQFFRRKEMVTAMLTAAHAPSPRRSDEPSGDDEEDLWE
jgi:hypothetical protein